MVLNKFIKFLINCLIFILVASLILVICFAFYVFLFSRKNDISLEDSLAYFQVPSNEIMSGLYLTSKDAANLSVDNYNPNESLTVNNTNKNYFYYNQLDNTSKTIYNSLENNIDNLKKENYTIDFSTKFNTLLNKSNGQNVLNASFQAALDAFFYDHPELFYIDLTKISLSIKYTTIVNKTTYKVSLVPANGNNYLYDSFKSQAQVTDAISKVNTVRKNIVKTLSNNMSDYEKALKVHDTLVNSLEYNSSLNNSYNIYRSFS